MARLDIAPSWHGGYALPANVLDEPIRRGTITTGYTPRGTFDDPVPSPPWDPGYALPENVRDEPLGANPIVTKYLPRRTVSSLMPPLFEGVVEDILDEVKTTPDINVDTGVQWLDNASWRYGFGDDGDVDDGAGTGAVDEFGDRAAHAILQAARSLPSSERAALITDTLEQLEPGLSTQVRNRAATLARQGLDPRNALENAIAQGVSAGLVAEVFDAAASRRVSRHSMLGLGTWGPLDDELVGLGRSIGLTRRGGAGTESRRAGSARGSTRTVVRASRTPTATPSRCPPIFKERSDGRGYHLAVPGALRHRKEWTALRAQACFTEFPQLAEIYEGAKRKHGGVVTRGEKPFMRYRPKGWTKSRLYVYYDEGNGRLTIRKKTGPGRLERWGKRALRMLAGVSTIGASEVFYRRADIARGAKSAGRFVGRQAKTAGRMAKNLAKDLGKAACQVVSHPAGQAAIGAAGATQGAPPEAGVAAAQVAAGLCAAGRQRPAPPPDLRPAPAAFPVVPVMIGGGVLLAVLLLRR